MKLPRAFLFAVLVYVTLDLSIAMMPGAFMFEPDDSVESIRISRGRTATEVVTPLALVSDFCVLPRSAVDLDRLARFAQVPSPVRFVMSCHWPRAALAAPRSEDPH